MALKLRTTLLFVLGCSLIFSAGVVAQEKEGQEITQESYLKAAREGELETIKAAIESGIDVDVKTEYGATALFFACDRGHEELVAFLLDKGADPNAKDTFYNATPVVWAQGKGNDNIIVDLIEHGGKGADGILAGAVAAGKEEFVKRILATTKISQRGTIKARDAAAKLSGKEQRETMLAIFEPLGLPEMKTVKIASEVLQRYPGKYTSERVNAEIELKDKKLFIVFPSQDGVELTPVNELEFEFASNEVQFELDDDGVSQMTLKFGENKLVLKPAKATEEDQPEAEPKPEMKEAEATKPADSKATESKLAESEAATKEPFQPLEADLKISSSNWPGFRGNGARGVADGQNPPIRWHHETHGLEDKETGDDSGRANEQTANVNVLWRQPVPGLGLSCPTIWEDKIFITSAVAEGDEGGLKIGLYGDVASVEEDKEYEFKVFCYSKKDGKLLWEQTANKAKPAVKRHAKSSHANPTVATNGSHVVAFFSSEGLYCYSSTGELLWKTDFGLLDSGWFYDPGYQWGFASSPVIHEDRVIVQCDHQGQSFVAALALDTGEELWRTDREEIPTWSSPTIHTFGETTMVLTNGTKAARAYDVNDGSLLWTLKGHSEIVVPTPNVAHGKIYIASGYSPIQPIYAISPEARGDISLEENTTTNEHISWSVKRGGPYMPSPIIYGDYLYCCANSGILTCYDAKSGKVMYKKRMKTAGGALSFTASPLAADGHLYFTAEDGRVLVVKAGPEYDLVEVNEIGESVLATPAISAGAFYFRTQDSLIAVGTSNE